MKGANDRIEYPGLSELEKMADAVNYNDWLFSRAAPFLGKRTVEVGCGIGVYVRLAAMQGIKTLGIEPDPTCLQLAQEKLRDLDDVELIKGDICCEETMLAMKSFAPDSAYCFNVLEHIEDDRMALGNMASALKPGGMLILIVPAFPCLYGANDELVGHYRRYKMDDLGEKLTDAGLLIQDQYYLNSVGFFAWFFLNRILRQSTQSGAQIGVYDRVVIPALRRLESRWHFPFGQSLVAIAKRT